MILSYSHKRSLFFVKCAFEERHVPRELGFEYVEAAQAWCTRSPYVAFSLKQYADSLAAPFFTGMTDLYAASWAVSSDFKSPTPEGCELLPYQRAGVEFVKSATDRGDKSALVADPMGLGKTVESVCTLNALYIPGRNVLVVCPASLRINWQREIDKWSTLRGAKAEVVRNGACRPDRNGPLVISYDLASSPAWAETLSWYWWDVIIFDEAHYLKNQTAARTRALIGQKGLVDRAGFVMLLTGTPIPNRPHEFFYPIKRLAPHVIDSMGEADFLRRFVLGFEGPHGWQAVGARNTQELHNRLRASGWMLRRDKATVLPQLPPKRHILVVFPQDSATARVVEKESAFSAQEIIKHGVPAGCASLPELRREMGAAKLPECVAWVKDALANGSVEKMLLFAYHTEVIGGLAEGLAEYGVAVVAGATSMSNRQARVDAFQNDPAVRVLVGSFQPAGVGWTLTAAHDVVFIEGSWVPSDNEQCIDRTHRFGQEADKINIYYLVVEGSLDAHILGTAASKSSDIERVLG